MKRIILLTTAFVSISAFTQNANDFLVSLSGIGSLKIGMTVEEVEKITGQTISLVKKEKEYIMDTISVNFKGAALKITFYNEYVDKDKYKVAVYAISCSSPLCKTRSGVSIGDDKMKIITTYDTYFMQLSPELDDAGNGVFKPSKIRARITLHGQEENGIIEFQLVNNKIISFTVSMYEGC